MKKSSSASTSSRWSSPWRWRCSRGRGCFRRSRFPTGSMEPNLLVGDHLIVNKMVHAPTASGLERAILPRRDIHRGDVIVFKYPAGSDARLHQARDRPARRTSSSCAARRSTSTARCSTEPYAHFLMPLSPEGSATGRRPARGLRPGHRANRPVLHDGRQPRRLAGQPLLGLHARELRQGQGALHLLLGGQLRRRHAVGQTARIGCGERGQADSMCCWPPSRSRAPQFGRAAFGPHPQTRWQSVRSHGNDLAPISEWPDIRQLASVPQGARVSSANWAVFIGRSRVER